MDFNTAAENVHKQFANLDDDRQAALDPAWIATLIQLLPVLIQVVQGCMPASKVRDAADRPRLVHRVVVNQVIRREIGNKAFRKHGRALAAAIFETASKTKPEEIQDLYDLV